MSDKKRIFWDSCVFIILLSIHKNGEYIEKQKICKSCLQEAIDGNVDIFISTITFVEVNKTLESAPPIPDTVKNRIRELMNQPYIKVVNADLARAIVARDFIWQYTWLRPMDALNASCALYAEVDEMLTYDGKGKEKGLLDLDGKLGTRPLKICKPYYEGQSKMI